MEQLNVTNPQPSGNPLNLLYKGVFSTRIGKNHKSKFGQYLDKLHHIKFLGIGTYSGSKLPGIINAVMVNLTSINQRVEQYKATRKDRLNESVKLEALGGTVDKSASLSDYKLAQENIPVKPLDILSTAFGLPVPLFAYYTRDFTATEVKWFDTLLEIMSNEIIRQADAEDGVLAERLDKLKVGGMSTPEFTGKTQRTALDTPTERTVEASNKSIFQAIVHNVQERMYDRWIKYANIDEVITVLKSVMETDVGYLQDGLSIFEQIKGVADLLSFHGRVLKIQVPPSRDVLMKRVQNSRQPAVINFDHEVRADDSKEYKAVLDALYKDFVKIVEGLEQDSIITGGESFIEEGLLTDFFTGDRQIIITGTEVDDLSYLATSDINVGMVDKEIGASPASLKLGVVPEHIIGDGSDTSTGIVSEVVNYDNTSLVNTLLEFDDRAEFTFTPHAVNVLSDVYMTSVTKSNTTTEFDTKANRVLAKPGSELDSYQGEMTNEQPVYTYDFEAELFGELSSTDPTLLPQFGTELIAAELMNEEKSLFPSIEPELWGELINEDVPLVPSVLKEVWGELTNDDSTLVPTITEVIWGELTNESTVLSSQPDDSIWGDLANEPTELYPEPFVEMTAVEVPRREGFARDDHEIAVFGCVDPNLKYRRRPPLEPDKKPEDPLFEWVCTEGYVCDDWLIVPLKDFNFENPDMDGFYDPVTLEPYFPTGQTDEDGNPYVLPPYSVLNEPISNGADVGGKEPMMIDPCNLYSFIEYTVKIYDAYKSRFQASSPVDTISRVLNMLYEQVVKLIGEWDETKGYTPDELWRIYRFIRWMALGTTYRFYRVKLEYTYGDFLENFEVYPFSNMITTEGAVRKQVDNYGWVLEGHPILDTLQNKAAFEFKLPKKTRSSTISFELGNHVPDRPDELAEGGITFQEDFEGVAEQYKLKGTGWVPVQTQGGTGLGVEHPAQAKTYRTTTFNVPSNALNPSARFNYGIDTNMDTKLVLKKEGGAVVWESSGVVHWGQAQLNPIEQGDYYFEVTVPQAESSQLREIVFDAQKIQNEWKKTGYITLWKVVGDTIYEEENTGGYALVVNEQWLQDSDYEFEFEFYTKEDPSLYWAYDWLGGVFNYRDPNNYYRIGTWSDLDRYNSGIEKVVDGSVVQQWKFNELFLWKFNTWHNMKIKVQGNHFQVWIDGKKYFDITDSSGWGYGASGLAAFSNPFSTFRRAKYKGKPRFHAFIDNVAVEAPSYYVPVPKPKYAIDFYLDGDVNPRILDYSSEGKRTYSFPILEGEHKGRWVFKKIGTERSVPQDASFIDNIVVKGLKPIKVDVVEEVIGCGGHLAVKLLIENLLEYYRRHHQGCKGERNIWIIE